MSAVSNEQQTEQPKKKLNYQRYYHLGILMIMALIILFLITRVFPNYSVVLISLYKIILPFFLSLLLAYLFNPIVSKLTQFRLPRWATIIVLYLFIVCTVSAIVYFTYPIFIDQAKRLIDQLPLLITGYRDWINHFDDVIGVLPDAIHQELDATFNQFEKLSADWIEKRIIGFTSLHQYLISLAVVPVLLYYFLLEPSKIRAKLFALIPKKYQKRSKQLLKKIDKDLGYYIRGQLLICLFVALTTYIVYLIIKLEFSLLLALFMGIMNIIPYFGPIIGALPAVLLVITTSPSTLLYLLIGIIVVQLVESNLLSPLILGRSVHIHPVIVILVLLIGSELAGIIGMILSVPIFVIIRSVASCHLISRD